MPTLAAPDASEANRPRSTRAVWRWTSALRLVSQNNLHVVGPAVVEQRDRSGIYRRAVQRGLHDTSAPARRVGHRDLVAAVEEPPDDPILWPRGWNARVDDERLATAPQAKN